MSAKPARLASARCRRWSSCSTKVKAGLSMLSPTRKERKWSVSPKAKQGAMRLLEDSESEAEKGPESGSDEGWGDDRLSHHTFGPHIQKASKAFTKSLVGVHQKETASTTSIDTVDNDIGAPLGSTCTEDDSTSIDIRKGVNMGVSCPNNKESELMVSSSSDEVDVTRLSVSKVAMSLHEGQEKHLTAWGPSPSSPLSQTKSVDVYTSSVTESGSGPVAPSFSTHQASATFFPGSCGVYLVSSSSNICTSTKTKRAETSKVGGGGVLASPSLEKTKAGKAFRELDTFERLDAAEARSEKGILTFLEEWFEKELSRLDLDLMIAAVSAMLAMATPRESRVVLWVVCLAIVIFIPAQRLGLLKQSPGGASSANVVVREQRARAVSKGADDSGNDALKIGRSTQENEDAEASETAVAEVREIGLTPPVHDDDSTIHDDGGAAHDDGDDDDEGTLLAGQVAKEGGGGVAPDQRLYRELLAGLSKVHVEYIGSAGKKERYRILHQCLEYANGNIAQALKVCTTFCNFRISEGWDLVLSPEDLEGPLRSRVHTLTEERDSVGRVILTFSPGKLDMKKASPAAYHKTLCYILQEALKEPGIQTKGIVLLVDARDVGFGLLRHFGITDFKRGLRMLSGSFPAKLKAIRILHPTRIISAPLSIAMPLLSAKMRDRLEMVSGDKAGDGSFTKDLVDPSAMPVELSIGGTWTGSQQFWGQWVTARV